jgi:hypothetical protein
MAVIYLLREWAPIDPADWQMPATLDGFPEAAREEMRCDGTESLVDWR